MRNQLHSHSRCADLFPAHFAALRERYDGLLDSHGVDVLAIHAGQVKRYFQDDREYPFVASPQFRAVCPLQQAENCWVIWRKARKPVLIMLAGDEVWSENAVVDDAFWLPMFHVELISEPHQVEKHLPYDKSRTCYMGEHIEVAQALGIDDVNPESILSYLHYHRIFKSEYEISCIKAANQMALKGHDAAEAAFFAGSSEFECFITYLQAVQQHPQQLPYEAIVAHNEHAAILHYRGKSTRTSLPKSMMIDAGASVNGYAADISRSYAFSSDAQNELYSALIAAVDGLCLRLIDWVRPNRTYAELHEKTHSGIATILAQTGLITLEPQDIVDSGLTRLFMPHGFGHFLGLQVHDVGGNLEDVTGRLAAPPAKFPTLKTTRKIEPRQVITIEPGIYFIDSLMQRLLQHEHHRQVNWKLIDALRPYGGVRIEDNILISDKQAINLTRAL